MTLRAVLWDMDGTLVDSEPTWARIQIDLLTSLGGHWTVEDCVALAGAALPDAVAAWLAALPAGVVSADELTGRMYAEVVRALTEHVDPRPGAVELLQALNAAGIPCALVSASHRVMIEAVLSHLPPDLFDVIVAGDEVALNKPHPEPYLTAARHLGVDAEDCVVIEDSPNGVASGTAAGAFVVAVPQWLEIPAAPRRLVTTSLEGMSPDSLRALVR